MSDFTMAGKGFTRWHIVRGGGRRSICGSAIYTELVKAQHVPVDERCMNTACRGNWPDYRARGDNTLMRTQSDRGTEP